MPASKKTNPQVKKAVATVKKSSRSKAGEASSGGTAKSLPFGQSLSVEALVGLTAELTMLRQYPPVVQRKPGKYEGDILGFVRGLRLSARVLYFLREHLSDAGFDVCWGHLISAGHDSCSPECDIIVHEKGLIKRWNGYQDPVMNFSFVKASAARVVVSCKSVLTSIDPEYTKDLKRHGVKQIFLFAESCRESQISALRAKAKTAGYAGLWCLYTTKPNSDIFSTNERKLVEFGKAMISAAQKARNTANAAEKSAAKKMAAKKSAGKKAASKNSTAQRASSQTPRRLRE